MVSTPEPHFLLSVALIFYPSALNKTIMATNKPAGDGHRKGAVKERSQLENPITGTMTKRDLKSGEFMDVKKGEGKFKGVRKEK